MTRKKPKGAHASDAVPDTVTHAGVNGSQAAGSSTRKANTTTNHTLAGVNGGTTTQNTSTPPLPTLVICRNKYTALLPIEVALSGLDRIPRTNLLTGSADTGVTFLRTMALG
jgi:hypothetical protein